MAMAAVERGAGLFADLVERHPAALVSSATATIGGMLAALDGLDASTAAATGVAGLTIAVCTILAKTLLADIAGLRARVATLEEREANRLAAMDAERARMAARITDLEARLAQQDGDGK